MVLVDCGTVMVIGMLVVPVPVDVQRGNLAGRGDESQSNQDGGRAVHRAECTQCLSPGQISQLSEPL